jgi:hypothetical protein
MKANEQNTIIYPKIQAIEPTLKSKKSNVLIGIGFVLFIGGIGLGYLGLKVFDFSHIVGIIVTFSGIPFFIAGHRLSPVCEFPKTKHETPPHNDDWYQNYSLSAQQRRGFLD